MQVDEMRPILMALYAALDSPECEYAHQWEAGDLILSNNLAVAHRPGPGAHAPVEEVGTLHYLLHSCASTPALAVLIIAV